MQEVGFIARYLGGYKAKPKPQDVHVIVDSDRLWIPELELAIPYNRMSGVDLVPQKTPWSILIPFYGARQLKDAKMYTILNCKDENGAKYHITLDVELPNEFQAAMRQRVEALKAQTTSEAKKKPE